MRRDAKKIIEAALAAAQPDVAVQKALGDMPETSGRLILVAVGKAAWQMAYAAYQELGEKISEGIVITKHGHSKGEIGNLQIREAGHPVPDQNTYTATQEALDMVSGLNAEDWVLFLLSGGGSALFEKPLIPENEMDDITGQLLASGADIVEMNTLRKHLSGVKGGRFAQTIAPAQVYAVVLCDILGDPLDMIASGPAYPDSSTCEMAQYVADKYNITLSSQARSVLGTETPKALDNVTAVITGSVRQLCLAAEKECRQLGYEPVILTDTLNCEARDAGSFLASIGRYYAAQEQHKPTAFIAGGETVVHLTGKGKGGRNQEIALAGARGIDGLENVLLFSVGSDGTDGPTDAAGGMTDGKTVEKLREQNINIDSVLADNDAYHALEKTEGLIMTGPTGTNVNDLTVLLVR